MENFYPQKIINNLLFSNNEFENKNNKNSKTKQISNENKTYVKNVTKTNKKLFRLL